MLKIILKNGTRIYKMHKLVGMYNVDIINNLILKEN